MHPPSLSADLGYLADPSRSPPPAMAMHSVVAPESMAVAVADHRPPPVSQRTRRRGSGLAMTSLTQQQRRQGLEQEVAELKRQLSKEQTVQQVLERALQPSAARAAVLTIPAFIPTKAKELLAELLLVEEEIARLEDQIHTMKKQQRPPLLMMMTSSGSSCCSPPAPDATHAPAKSPRPSAAAAENNSHHQHPPEFKSMFFISQAMDGDYLNKHVNKQQSPKLAMTSSRQQHPAAAEPPKILLPITLTISNKKKSHPQTQTATPTATITKNTNSPNKLSERIVKCLVCIFIRLLRSSRAADLDKATRSAGNNMTMMQQQGSSSFRSGGNIRMDTSLSVDKAAADYRQGQQDHYGIFAIPDAIVRDIGPYKNLVSFTSTSFDLRAFSTSPLLSKLRGMLEALHHVQLLNSLTHHQKLAFWLNVYNTCIMHGILQHGLPSNSEKLLALKNKATINVSGQKFNALVIENFILRQPSSVKQELWKCDVDVEEQQVRELYGLKSSEPNILFAMCCGIRSSPALRIYKADRVAMDLEKAKLEYLQASLVVTSTRRLLIPGLIHANMHDFAKDMESLLRWICEQLPTSWSLRKSMVECLTLRRRQQTTTTTTTHFKTTMLVLEEVVDVIPFDYEFQYLLPM